MLKAYGIIGSEFERFVSRFLGFRASLQELGLTAGAWTVAKMTQPQGPCRVQGCYLEGKHWILEVEHPRMKRMQKTSPP